MYFQPIRLLSACAHLFRSCWTAGARGGALGGAPLAGAGGRYVRGRKAQPHRGLLYVVSRPAGRVCTAQTRPMPSRRPTPVRNYGCSSSRCESCRWLLQAVAQAAEGGTRKWGPRSHACTTRSLTLLHSTHAELIATLPLTLFPVSPMYYRTGTGCTSLAIDPQVSECDNNACSRKCPARPAVMPAAHAPERRQHTNLQKPWAPSAPAHRHHTQPLLPPTQHRTLLFSPPRHRAQHASTSTLRPTPRLPPPGSTGRWPRSPRAAPHPPAPPRPPGS